MERVLCLVVYSKRVLPADSRTVSCAQSENFFLGLQTLVEAIYPYFKEHFQLYRPETEHIVWMDGLNYHSETKNLTTKWQPFQYQTVIARGDGSIINPGYDWETQIRQIAQSEGRIPIPITRRYTALFPNQVVVQFDSLDFLSGALFGLKLFDLPKSKITELHEGGAALEF